jgi:hypothetical protein
MRKLLCIILCVASAMCRGMDISPGTSAEFEHYLRAEIAQWKKVAQGANIKAD